MRFDYKSLSAGLDKLEGRTDAAVRLYADTAATSLQGYAQKNASWVDRSGRARQTLQGWVEPKTNGYRINIGHGVDYGIYLELAHEKRFAIIPNTLNYCSKKIMQGFENLLGRLSK